MCLVCDSVCGNSYGVAHQRDLVSEVALCGVHKAGSFYFGCLQYGHL